MIIVNRSIRFFLLTLCLSVSGMLVSSPAMADKFRVKIRKIESDMASGDVMVQIKPASGESGFTGKVQVLLPGSDIGINRALATLLTAVSLGAEVVIKVPFPPSADVIQPVTGLSVVVP